MQRAFSFLSLLCFALSLHLRIGHHQNSNLLLLTNLESSIMAKVLTLESNAEDNSKQLFAASATEDKIQLLQAYLLSQRKVLLEIYRSSMAGPNMQESTCPIVKSEDREAFLSFDNSMERKLNELKALSNNSRLQQEVSDILPLLALNSISPSSKSTDVEDSRFAIQVNTNINFGSFVVSKEKQGLITSGYQAIQNYGKYNSICPYSTPFADQSGKCISCPPLYPFFLVDNFTCIACTSYNQTTHTCFNSQGQSVTGASYFTNFNAGKNQLLLSQSQNWDEVSTNKQNLQICPPDRPFSTGSTCISCSMGLYYSLGSSNCQTCASGQFYNLGTHLCQTQYYFSNLNNLQWETKSKQIDDILEDITIKRSNQSYTSCGLEKPFSTNDACLGCQKGTHFSYDTLSCSECQNGTQLDLNMHKCLKPQNLNFQTNPQNTSNLIYNGKSKNEWMNIYYQNIQNQSGIADCPISTPNFDGLACISCPHSQPYFNLQLMVCQACEGTTLYDEAQCECVSSDDKRPIQTPTWEKMASVVFSK